MTRKPEDAVIEAINALEAEDLVDRQLVAGETTKPSIPLCRCGGTWHGLPRNGCPGSHEAGEFEPAAARTGVAVVDEHYVLNNVRRGLLQTIPSTFAVYPPPADRESFLRQFNAEVHRIAVAAAAARPAAADFMGTSGYDSPLARLLSEGRSLRIPHQPQLSGLAVNTEITQPEIDERRELRRRRFGRLFRLHSL